MREHQFSLSSLLVVSTGCAVAFRFWPWSFMGVPFQVVLFAWCVCLGTHIYLLITMLDASINSHHQWLRGWLAIVFYGALFSALFSSIMLIYLLPKPLPSYGTNMTSACFVLGVGWIAACIGIVASFMYPFECGLFSRLNSIRIVSLLNLLFPILLPHPT